jgi:peptidoglycan/xylan/chitin deacetylase (PgdA/CDA1 family)
MPQRSDPRARPSETCLPSDFRWPGGKRLAVVFRFAFEAWSDETWPGNGPMGNPLKPGYPDLNARSWAAYAVRCGVQRGLEVFARHGIRGTFITSGQHAERHPQIVRAIAQAGHEVCAHAYTMDRMAAYLSEDEERDEIRRNADVIEAATGIRPVGWINPRATPSPSTARLLAEAGYDWHGDALDDDLPYLQHFGDRSLVVIPGTMEVNDLPLFNHRQPPDVFVSNFEHWLAYVRRHERGAVKIDPSIHGHCFARPGSIWAYDRVMEIARGCDDVWIGTRAEIAAHVRAVLGAPRDG